jgi:hypothetical protein
LVDWLVWRLTLLWNSTFTQSGMAFGRTVLFPPGEVCAYCSYQATTRRILFLLSIRLFFLSPGWFVRLLCIGIKERFTPDCLISPELHPLIPRDETNPSLPSPAKAEQQQPLPPPHKPQKPKEL